MDKRRLGATLWLIPDGFIPVRSSGILESHEAICLLNCYDQTANVSVTIYYEDTDPLQNIELILPGQRTKHVRTDDLERDGQKIPTGIPYALKVESDVPIVVQHSRMDSTQAENTLMTTMAFPLD